MSTPGLHNRLPICRTCGAQYDLAVFDPQHCKVCEDERQYVGWNGQEWTNLAELAETGYKSRLGAEFGEVTAIGVEPKLGIGQRALLIPGAGGNLLWDCVPYLDDDTVELVRSLGGLAAIAISHPHYYTAMVDWSRAFGDVPIYLHEGDREWVCRKGAIEFWSGRTLEVLPGRTLINTGVHFRGGTVLHWADGAAGAGALCSGDIFQVVPDRRWVSFMYSYPNLIPEHPDVVRRSVELVEPYEFDVLYGAWWDMVVTQDAKNAVRRSAERYLRHVGADG
jgi:hypothetical protein